MIFYIAGLPAVADYMYIQILTRFTFSFHYFARKNELLLLSAKFIQVSIYFCLSHFFFISTIE